VRVSRRAWIGRFLGPVLAVVAYFALPAGQGGLSQAGMATVPVGILMAVWWITEALPLPATALLPIALMGPARYCQSTSADITNLKPGVHNV
jgi:sodium-dependent dicarboxylate transporter 2/3/5